MDEATLSSWRVNVNHMRHASAHVGRRMHADSLDSKTDQPPSPSRVCGYTRTAGNKNCFQVGAGGEVNKKARGVSA